MADTAKDGDVPSKRQDPPLRVDIPPRPKESEVQNAYNAANLVTTSPKSSTTARTDYGQQQTKSEAPRRSNALGQDGSASWNTSEVGSPDSNTDRVFPIRSVVSVDPSQQTPFTSRQSNEGRDYFHAGGIAGIAGIDIARASSPRHRPSVASPDIESKTPNRVTRPSEQSSDPKSRRDRKSSISTAYSEPDRYAAGRKFQLFSSDAGSEKSNERSQPNSLKGSNSVKGSVRPTSQGSGFQTSADVDSGLVTARFKHVVTSEGHAVITGRGGDTLQRCEDEPIHIPGAVQGFGLLIALQEQEEGDMLVRVVSENSKRIIGYSPQQLFKLKSFTDILSEEQTDNLLDHVDFIRDEENDPMTNGPEVFTISIRPPGSRKSQKLWCAMHINPVAPNLIICEFEMDDDQVYPLVPANDDTPEPPEDTLHGNPTREELEESTQITSKPLRVLRSARKRKGEQAAMEVFNIMSQVQEQLAAAPNLDSFLKILVGVVKELTGFHRVMIYQFDAAFNGRVVTELVDPRATVDLYKGLNFPASDIPKQARDLYKVNKVRLLYDRDLETARLVCRSVEDLERPLDLTFSYLRAMSPIHIKYLANMAVRSSMSISINAFGELWGLIACHTYGPKGMRVSFPIRKMCRLVGDTASRNIERLSYASRLQARKLINTVPTDANPSGYIVASSDDLLKLFDADFGLLSIRGETKIMGKIEKSQEALAMLEYLRLRKITSVLTSQDIRTDFPDLRYPPGFDLIAGVLVVPLTVGGSDFIVFLRKGQVKEVKWAGNPYEKFVKEGTEGYLEPRKSFKTWSETVIGKCREWTEEQIETAAVLCLVYGKFIEVWRQKEAAFQNSELTRLLLANSAHEVRTPLNAIINYLEIALEGALDQETRDNLAKSHSASKSLIYVINDLLDLTKTEEGQDLGNDEVFDLLATIREATDSFKGDAKRKGLEYELTEHPGVPQLVHGDPRRVRQAVANVTANAMQNTSVGWIRVEVVLQEIVDGKAIVEIIVQDSGAGMSNEKLDGLFRDLEQVSSDNGEDLLGDKNNNSQQLQTKQPRTLGLGLATVARLVRNMDGQLRLKSEEGKGSRFVISLPFVIPDDGPEDENKDSGSSKMAVAPLSTPPPDGEVTLVKRASSAKSPKPEGVVRKSSVGESSSLRSFKSASSKMSNKSGRSDVDRLIDAISGPLAVGEPEPQERTQQRSSSKGSVHSRRSHASMDLPTTTPLTDERPGAMARSKSYVAPEHLRTTVEGPAGSEYITDVKTPLKAVRVPEEFTTNDDQAPQTPSRVLFEIPDKKNEPELDAAEPREQDLHNLHVLVAEDDPINSKIMLKRLEKFGHKVQHTVNGEDCASAYGEAPASFDVVLMDMQMPIVDGLTSAKMIRSHEKSHPQSNLSPRALSNGRVPIFAVSASLLERERQTYINAGFDGWVLKPIDFKRLNTLLEGIVKNDTRNSCLYQPGNWERGGWFYKRQPTVLAPALTKPSDKSPVQNPPPDYTEPRQPDTDSISSSGSESKTVTPGRSRSPLVYEERPNEAAADSAAANPSAPENVA